MRWLILALALVLMGALGGCRCDSGSSGPPIPASSDPEGKDIVEGSIVVAHESTSGGVRIYKVKEVVYFPPPVGDELVMLAFNETGNDFQHAAALWKQRKLTVAVANARVRRAMFITRDYRVIGQEPVTDAEKALKASDAFP